MQATRIDAKQHQQQLQVFRPALTDHPNRNSSVLIPIVAPNGHVAVSLEDALQISAYLVPRSRPQTAGNADVDAPREKLPSIHEVTQHLTVKANASYSDFPGVGFPDLSMNVREYDVEVPRDPVVFVVAGDLKLDRQRTIGPLDVLADEAVGLKPAGERRLGDLQTVGLVVFELVLEHARPAGSHERRAGDLRTMGVEVQPHPHLELVDAQPARLSASLARGFDHVIRRSLDEATVTETHSPHRLAPVGLDSHDAGGSTRVVDLSPDLLVLDDLADRDHPVWS